MLQWAWDDLTPGVQIGGILSAAVVIVSLVNYFASLVLRLVK